MIFRKKENDPAKKEVSDLSEKIDLQNEKKSVKPVESVKHTPDDDFFTDEIFPSSPPARPEAEVEDEDPFQMEGEVELSAPAARETGTMTGYEETGVGEYPARVDSSQKQSLYEYEEDYKQDGLNYKPILIGIGAVAALVVIFFLISNLFLSDSAEVIPEQQAVESAADKLEREQAERKTNFLADINKNRRVKLSGVNYITGLEQKNVKYSSILLYGNSLDFEIFVPNRDVLAKYNIKIKDSRQIEKYKIEKVDFRPGTNGGLLALYNITIRSEGITATSESTPIKTVTPEAWAGTVLQQAGATVKGQRTVSSRQENLFRVNRIEYELRGSMQNFFALIGSLASSNYNISIHKLTLLPTDQRKISPSSYVLRLIVDFYL